MSMKASEIEVAAQLLQQRSDVQAQLASVEAAFSGHAEVQRVEVHVGTADGLTYMFKLSREDGRQTWDVYDMLVGYYDGIIDMIDARLESMGVEV